jgi:hypothetical protein
VEADVLEKTMAQHIGPLRLQVADAAMAAASYAQLGVRVLRCSARRAVLELPCGLHLVLSSPARRARAGA